MGRLTIDKNISEGLELIYDELLIITECRDTYFDSVFVCKTLTVIYRICCNNEQERIYYKKLIQNLIN